MHLCPPVTDKPYNQVTESDTAPSRSSLSKDNTGITNEEETSTTIISTKVSLQIIRLFPKARPRKTGAENMEEAGSRQMLQRKAEIGNQKAEKGKMKHLGKYSGRKL
jgi:hypothetical protein